MIPQEYFDKVKKYFNGDEKKTWDWWQSTHPQFGMLSPLNLMKLGRKAKIISFIDKEMKK